MKLICMICGSNLDLDLDNLEEFVPNRIWGLIRHHHLHYCGHESAFERSGEPIYCAFLCKPEDRSALLLSKFVFSKWKNKLIYHYQFEGIETKDRFKKMLKEFLDEADYILKNPNIAEKEEKIRLLAQRKFDKYKEIIVEGNFEKERGKYLKE